ncbi:MAG: TIGR02594 family protein [Afipia sp.]|nr:TIGR02594 family protein [Afipia sp.]OJW63438.1 MAG: amidase [Afipia sp. 64-13]
MNLSSVISVRLRHVAIAMCSAAIVALATPASARPSHHHRHHHVERHAHSHVRAHHVRRHRGHRHASRWMRSARALRAANVADANAAMDHSGGSFGGSGFGASNLVDEARRYIGGNPTGRSRLWCARFMNMVLQRTGHQGTGSDMARSFASYGQRISGPQVGAIAVMSRGRRGGHVGVVSGIDAKGNPIVISGNHGRRVAESVYSRGRIYAYVMPSS